MDNDQTISAENDLFTREIFMRIADKWTLLVIDALEQGTLRFSELQRKI
jgi:DNA-binding HxlR family transcriptional regulator